MQVFITQGRYSQAAIKGMVANPEDRAQSVASLIEGAGGRLLGYYVTFGEYDFLVIYEAPDPAAALSVLAIVGAGGGASGMKTMIAFTGAEAKQAFETASSSASQFRSAGQS